MGGVTGGVEHYLAQKKSAGKGSISSNGRTRRQGVGGKLIAEAGRNARKNTQTGVLARGKDKIDRHPQHGTETGKVQEKSNRSGGGGGRK